MTTAFVIISFLCGMGLMWVYMAFPRDPDTTGLVNVRCHHCGRTYYTSPSQLRVDQICSSCS